MDLQQQNTNTNSDQSKNMESYVPKPGEVIQPASKTQEKISQTPSETPTPNASLPAVAPEMDVVPVETIQPVEPATSANLTQPAELAEPVKSPSTIPMQTNSTETTKSIKPERSLIPFGLLKKIKKIVLIAMLLGVVVFGVLYALPFFMPKQEEYVPEQVIIPPVIQEQPKEDKTSLRFLDAKLREIQPSLNELNSDSVFLFELNLSSSDF